MWTDDPLTVPYRNRREAARQLAGLLRGLAGPDTIVLCIPRGGVPIAAEISHQLGIPFDLVAARKIGAPHQPELAIGAVAADGAAWIDEALVRHLRIDPDWLQRATEAARAEAGRRERAYRPGRAPLDLAGRTVILVDDGLATGATARAAARAIRRRRPARLVLAVPVAAPEAIADLRAEVDQLICPLAPPAFQAVGEFYTEFEQLTDGDVIAAMAGAGDPGL